MISSPNPLQDPSVGKSAKVPLNGTLSGIYDTDNLTHEKLFVRMAERSPEVHNLSTSVKDVSYPTDSLAVVVLRTEDGLQEVILRQEEGVWLIDLASLGPPVEGE